MKKRFADVITLSLLAGVITIFSLSYICTPQKDFSENENKALQTFPAPKFSNILDGSYTSRLHDYFADQVAFRTQMVEIKALFELLRSTKENNNILYGNNGYLIDTHNSTEQNYSYLQNNLNKIESIMSTAKERGIEVHSYIIPRKIDVLREYLPQNFSFERSQNIWSLVSDDHTSLLPPLYKAEANGASTFYRTDHHWTAEGAYIAYLKLAADLGFEAYPMEYFEIQPLSSTFFGTSYSKSGFFFSSADTIKAPSINSDTYLTTIMDTGESFAGFYKNEYLSKKDKYSTFLGGNHAHVKITDTQDDKKPKLIIIKDSFSHSLAPYLAVHFDLELIDPRYFNGSIESYITNGDFDKLVFIFGIETLSSANISIR